MVEVIDSNISYLPFPTFTGDGLAVWDSLTFIVASLLRRRLESFKVALRILL